MEYYDDGAYERISKSIAESRRGTWMPPRRRNKIKRKVVASCLVTLLGICCCTYCIAGPAGPLEGDDEPVIAKDTFVNISYQ